LTTPEEEVDDCPVIGWRIAAVLFLSVSLAAVAVGTASTAWADQTMSGHYIKTSTDPETGHSTNYDWYFTPCGDGCAEVKTNGTASGQARLINGQWTLDLAADAICDDGTSVNKAVNSHYTWDRVTLTGTVLVTAKVAACGRPGGYTQTNNIQLRQAP
jgi:hypothetical protein